MTDHIHDTSKKVCGNCGHWINIAYDLGGCGVVLDESNEKGSDLVFNTYAYTPCHRPDDWREQ